MKSKEEMFSEAFDAEAKKMKTFILRESEKWKEARNDPSRHLIVLECDGAWFIWDMMDKDAAAPNVAIVDGNLIDSAFAQCKRAAIDGKIPDMCGSDEDIIDAAKHYALFYSGDVGNPSHICLSIIFCSDGVRALSPDTLLPLGPDSAECMSMKKWSKQNPTVWTAATEKILYARWLLSAMFKRSALLWQDDGTEPTDIGEYYYYTAARGADVSWKETALRRQRDVCQVWDERELKNAQDDVSGEIKDEIKRYRTRTRPSVDERISEIEAKGNELLKRIEETAVGEEEEQK